MNLNEEDVSSLHENCVDCGIDFEISAGEQKFFHSKGYTLPKRCKACRLKKKQKNEANTP